VPQNIYNFKGLALANTLQYIKTAKHDNAYHQGLKGGRGGREKEEEDS
jgi:hypothetical protein